jgi:hypothetical protein
MGNVLYNPREYGFLADISEPYFLFDNDIKLKAHVDYRAAKAGDQVAAFNVVWDLAVSFLTDTVKNLPSNVIYVAPFAREATGDNAIPQVLAAICAEIAVGKIDNDIVQITRVFHTGADPMERLCMRAQFEGEVIRGEQYVLIDDVVNMGGTLAELADYIQQGGAMVAGVITLVNAGRIKGLRPHSSVIKKLQERYQHEIYNIFGIKPSALTANEAQYFIGFRTADEIRGRLVKAREEIHRRLRSKGIFYKDEGNEYDEKN